MTILPRISLQNTDTTFFHGKEVQLKPITGARLLEQLRSSSATAASWGQWEYGEWAAMPVEAAEWLAKLLQLIEGGANWPQPTTWEKAFFLAKQKSLPPTPWTTASA